MILHPSTFEYLKPTDQQIANMGALRVAARRYAQTIESHVPDGPDRDRVLRRLRELAMWVNVAVTREPDGTPRRDEPRL